MEQLVALSGFIGAWFLVAGPVHQAAIELRAEEVDRSAFAAATESAPHGRPVSPWWWLLPPVAIFLARRRSRQHRAAMLSRLQPAQTEQLVSFMNKANGWLTVATGAALIAVKETAELLDALEWGEGNLIPVVLGMLVLSLGFAVYRLLATGRLLHANGEAA